MNSPTSVKWIVGSLLMVVACFLVTTASAMTIRELHALVKSERKQGGNFVRYYQVGLMEGVLEAHAQAVRAGAKPAICTGERRLEPRMAEGLFETELKRNSDVYEADMPAQLVMFNALSSVYPCSD